MESNIMLGIIPKKQMQNVNRPGKKSMNLSTHLCALFAFLSFVVFFFFFISFFLDNTELLTIHHYIHPCPACSPTSSGRVKQKRKILIFLIWIFFQVSKSAEARHYMLLEQKNRIFHWGLTLDPCGLRGHYGQIRRHQYHKGKSQVGAVLQIRTGLYCIMYFYFIVAC